CSHDLFLITVNTYLNIHYVPAVLFHARRRCKYCGQLLTSPCWNNPLFWFQTAAHFLCVPFPSRDLFFCALAGFALFVRGLAVPLLISFQVFLKKLCPACAFFYHQAFAAWQAIPFPRKVFL